MSLNQISGTNGLNSLHNVVIDQLYLNGELNVNLPPNTPIGKILSVDLDDNLVWDDPIAVDGIELPSAMFTFNMAQKLNSDLYVYLPFNPIPLVAPIIVGDIVFDVVNQGIKIAKPGIYLIFAKLTADIQAYNTTFNFEFQYKFPPNAAYIPFAEFGNTSTCVRQTNATPGNQSVTFILPFSTLNHLNSFFRIAYKKNDDEAVDSDFINNESIVSVVRIA